MRSMQDALEHMAETQRSSNRSLCSSQQKQLHQNTGNGRTEEPLKGNLKVTSPEDAQHLGKKQEGPPSASANGTEGEAGPKASRGVVRRHTVGGARSSREILAMQPSDMDKKREAFLEHLKQKYPHHAHAIMGHQERLREQTYAPRGGCTTVSSVESTDQGSLSSLDALEVMEVMSEGDAPLTFTRGSRSRASLPVVRTTNQTKDRSLGVLYLQYGEETRTVRMPNEVSSMDTVRALFVSAFPQQLTMAMMESPSLSVYLRDDNRNIYHQLSDVRGIADQSHLKVYHKDPAHAFSHGPRPGSADARLHREMLYSGRDGPLAHRQPPLGSAPPHPHPLQGSMSPPPGHGPPPSPSRIPFGPRSPSVAPGNAPGGGTVTRDRAGSAARSASPCPSAILERRDVKPDELPAAKGMAVPPRGEGLYGDPYMIPMDLAYHRGPARPYGNAGIGMETVDHPSLYRQKSRKYGDSHLPALGSKTPPPSPHRMTEVRMIDIHGGQPQGGMVLERSSSIRQSFRKEAPIVMETAVKGRGPVGTPDLPGDPQTRERMKVMEQQIASLTGLVQNALLTGNKDPASDRSIKSGSPVHSTSSTSGSPILAPKSTPTPPDGSPAHSPPTGSALQVSLAHFRKNVSELRLQLQQMKQLQLQNQECVCAQLRRVEQEVCLGLAGPTQRALVDTDRNKYLSMEEQVLRQLGDLERYVAGLRADPDPGTGVAERAVSLREVEDGAVSLRMVGENLATLKADLPSLQARMRAVLRVEVEAVKFLKEEPHKLDSMLRRVRTLTETLSMQRRSAMEGLLKPNDTVTTVVTATKTETGVAALDLQTAAPTTPISEPQSSSVRSEVMTSNPVVIHHAQSSPVPAQQSQHSEEPVTSALHGRGSSPTQNTSPAPPKTPPNPLPEQIQHGNGIPANGHHGNGVHGSGVVSNPQTLFIEEIHTGHSKSKNRAMSIEAAEREWAERRQNMGHYDDREFERLLQEAESNMLRGIPSLEVPSESEIAPSSPAAPPPAPEEPEQKTEPTPAPPQDESVCEVARDRPLKAKLPLDRPPKPSLVSKGSLDRGSKVSQGTEKASKSPPPPPPRRNYGPPNGRSGETTHTGRKESPGEGEVETPVPPQPKLKRPPEVKPKPCTPPPIPALTAPEGEDEGDKIMAELQVFQKCLAQDVGSKVSLEPQVRELRPGVLLPLKDRKNAENQEDKNPATDENANNTMRQSPGVIYYVTAQISKDSPQSSLGTEESANRREASPSQVSHVNATDQSQSQLQVATDGPSDKSKTSSPASVPSVPRTPSPPTLPLKQLTRSGSLRQSDPPQAEEVPASVTVGKVHVVKAAPVQISVEEKVESPTKCSVPTLESAPPLPTLASSAESQDLVLGSSKARERKYEELDLDEDAGLSPDLPGEEAPPPPDNFAFMITNTKVQALSTGEYHQLVSAKQGNVQTVTVGNKPQTPPDLASGSSGVADGSGPNGADNNWFSKKPVIIIFDEPIDIRSAYKRLSTVFECEEEMERMLAEERIDEESEENEEDEVAQVNLSEDSGKVTGEPNSAIAGRNHRGTSSSSSSLSEAGPMTDVAGDTKQDSKKKFKLKFPKKQLAALTQALRTGTKTGKKTLQVVVYEDEEESDGTVKHKESKRFEIAQSKHEPPKTEASPQDLQGRTEEIRKNTYQTLDSLEQTIRQLETTISEMGPKSPEDGGPPEDPRPQGGHGGEASEPEKVPPAKSLCIPKPSTSSKGSGLRKKPKPKLLPRPAVIPTSGVSVTAVPTQQNASVVSPTSRMPVPVSAKARQSPGSSERATKQQKLQDSQRQFRQANGSAKRSGGDPKSTSPAMSASKIPAFSSSAGKGVTPDASNPANSPSLPSSSTLPNKSSIPSPRSSSSPSTHIPSLSNGSLKLAPPTHTTKGLSFSSQTQNGRPSSISSPSNSSSHSPLSPTMLAQGVKTIRTIHTPSFTSYSRSHSGNKSAIPAASAAKDSS